MLRCVSDPIEVKEFVASNSDRLDPAEGTTEYPVAVIHHNIKAMPFKVGDLVEIEMSWRDVDPGWGRSFPS